MAQTTLLFVHGTGVRNKSYVSSLNEIKKKAAEFKLPCRVEELLWGDVLGVDFEGLSLPQPPERNDEEKAQAYRWEYLGVDPLFDLKLWCTPAAEPPKKVLGETKKAEELWNKSVAKYKPSTEMKLLSERYDVEPLFGPAWKTVMDSKLPAKAFPAAGDEDASIARVLAEAVVAQMMHDGAAQQPPVPIPFNVRSKLIDRLIYDWNQKGKGIKDLFLKLFGYATKAARPLRSGLSRAVAPAIGDILRYQSLGKEIRGLIRARIEDIEEGDVYVLAHSLGGIACFELMVEKKPASVKGLITAGSQAPLLYEFDSLELMKNPSKLPVDFPRWLNFYDENDLLSYRANDVFHVQADRQVDSMLPPLEAHSAYWKLDAFWDEMSKLVK